MVNPFDYLYYKIYSAWSYLNGGVSPVNQYAAIGLLYLANIFTIYMLITNEFPLDAFGYTSISIVGAFLFSCYRPKREAGILAKYSQESEQSRMIGNVTVVLYVIITIVAFALVLKAHITPVQPEINHLPPLKGT